MSFQNRPPRTITYQAKSFFGKAFIGLFIAAVFGFVALLLTWPFIFGGTILYVLVHFVRKIW